MQQLSSFTDFMSHEPQHAWLNSGSAIEGTLRCKGPVEIEGEVTGEIISNSVLIISESAVIHADITAEDIVIRGKVFGNITATNSISIEESGEFNGTMMAPSLEIEKGATFEGKSFMEEKPREADPAQDVQLENPVQDLQERLQVAVG